MGDDTPEVLMAVCPHCDSEVRADSLDTVRIRSMAPTTRREEWCETCRDRDAVWIEDMSQLVSLTTAELHYFQHDDGDWYSYPQDYDEDDSSEQERLLYQYSTDVLSVHGWPRRTRRDALCFGVELEMESVSRRRFGTMVGALNERDGNGRYILKHDGSLDDGCGAELVTLPYTLEDHKRVFNWPKVLSDKLRSVAKSGSGTTNCGIHVHVNRQALSPLTIGKMLVFLNSAENSHFVTTVAQRGSNTGYARRDSSKKVSSVREEGTRYDILNISGNRTVEFRMFRGNLRPERVLKNLEFCHALIRFCEANSLSDMTVRAFLRYIKKARKEYPFLTGFLIEKAVLPPAHERSIAQYALLARLNASAETADA